MRNGKLKKHLSLVLTILFISHAIYATEEPKNTPVTIAPTNTEIKDSKKRKADWNFMVYIASNNDLHKYSEKNIEQMKTIGSNNNVNILIQQDTYGKKEVSRYVVKKGSLKLKQTVSNKTEAISGTSESLYKFAEWAITNYQAQKYILILWNHGSGIEDPSIWGKTLQGDPNQIYTLNLDTGMMELNRYLLKLLDPKGIAFNEFFKTYLTNQDLKNTLSDISKKLLGGEKIDILGMDACNMAMLEVGTQVRDSVKYIVASEEAEPATGWNYALVLHPFLTKSFKAEELAQHIVNSYKTEYEYSYDDYTQSAIRLTDYEPLEKNINNVATCTLKLLEGKNSNDVFAIIKKIRRSSKNTTSFANKDYIDMHHFYESFLKKIEKQSGQIEDKTTVATLIALLKNGITLIETQVIASITSTNLDKARGLSIYFPLKRIHPSYYKTVFAMTLDKNKTAWLKFIEKYTAEQHLIIA